MDQREDLYNAALDRRDREQSAAANSMFGQKTLAEDVHRQAIEAHRLGLAAVSKVMPPASAYHHPAAAPFTTAKQNNNQTPVPLLHHVGRLESQNTALADILGNADALVATLRGAPNPSPSSRLSEDQLSQGLNLDLLHTVDTNERLIHVIRERIDEVRALVLG